MVSDPQDPLNIRGTSAPTIQITKALAIAKGPLSFSLSVDPLSALFLNNSSTRTTGRWFRPLARAPTCFP